MSQTQTRSGRQHTLANGFSASQRSLSLASSVSKESYSNIDDDSVISKREAAYLQLNGGNRNTVASGDETESVAGSLCPEDDPTKFAERAGFERVYIVFEIARHDDTRAGAMGPRWCLAWEVGSQRDTDDEHAKLRILELQRRSSGVYYCGATSRERELSTKYSVSVGELSLQNRVVFEELVKTVSTAEEQANAISNHKEWAEKVLNEAGQRGLFTNAAVQEAMRQAEKNSQPLRRESRRLSGLRIGNN